MWGERGTEIIVLSNPEKWDVWMDWMKKTAMADGIWNYVNPDLDLDESQQNPSPVAKPVGHDTEDGPSEWATMQYGFDRKAFDDHTAALARLNLKIFRSVIKKYLSLVRSDTPYENLRTLKKHVSFSAAARIRAVRRKYGSIQHGPTEKEVGVWMDWLCRYDRIWTEMEEMDLPEIQGDDPLCAFLNTARSFDNGWATAFRTLITAGAENSGEVKYTVAKLIENFRIQLYSIQYGEILEKGEVGGEITKVAK